jgi:hypothetical protein
MKHTSSAGRRAAVRCDLCGGAATVTVENDQVRDKRMRRKHYYNVIQVCDKCRGAWLKMMGRKE